MKNEAPHKQSNRKVYGRLIASSLLIVLCASSGSSLAIDRAGRRRVGQRHQSAMTTTRRGQVADRPKNRQSGRQRAAAPTLDWTGAANIETRAPTSADPAFPSNSRSRVV